jgi:hypothetical protein
MENTELVNPLDSMIKSNLAGEVVFLEATFEALIAIRKGVTKIDFMDPEPTEEKSTVVFNKLRDPEQLVHVLSALLVHNSDDEIRERQAKWTPELLCRKLSVRNIGSFISSIYSTLSSGRDDGADPTDVVAEGESNPSLPEDALSLPTTGQ